MSIFGQLDAANIPTNPFLIAKGTYEAQVVAAKFQENRDNVRQLYIQYEITTADSEYAGRKAAKIYNLVDADLTEKEFSVLPADDKKKIMIMITSLKKDLCGNEANVSQKGLGVSPDDLNDPNWNPATLVGTKVMLGITNYGTNDQGVNVRWVNLLEE